MKLFPYDAYTSLTRVFPRESPITVLDVGANEGQTIHRVLKEFPAATVHSFEPAPETFSLLERIARHEPRARAYPVACGASTGSVKFHVTGNHWCSSVLPPSELGQRLYGDWYTTKKVIDVPMVRLDDWARQHGVTSVDLLKVDAQGYDLEVLKGAVGLLPQVKAINCECQFAPEYEGCASFSQIDRFLVEHGFALHQLHEVNERGDEEQTTYGDGLWLRTDILAQLRSRKDLPDLSPKGRVRTALRNAANWGRTKAALYGSGRHTQGIAAYFDEFPLPIAAIIDDNKDTHGSRIAGCEVISADRVRALGIDVVILSSDAHEATLWHNSAVLRAQGVLVLPLYTKHLLDAALPKAATQIEPHPSLVTPAA